MNEVPGPESTSSQPPSQSFRDEFIELFPGLLNDGVLDANRLGELLDVEVSGISQGSERFGLMWAGRKKAVESLQAPSYAALVPDFASSVSWETAENVFIEGDNLEVLKLLQNAYNDQVKLIYIDPPYNTGNDFVYKDDFSDPKRHYLEVTGQLDAEGNRLVANTEVSGRKHSNWLSMMYPRLSLARNLLTQDGSIFVSIDDNEASNLRALLDEIFGPENFLGQFVWKSRTGGQDSAEYALQHEYVLAYARNRADFRAGRLTVDAGKFPQFDTESQRNYKRVIARKWGSNSRRQDRPSMFFPIIAPDGSEVLPMLTATEEGRWRWGRPRFDSELSAGNVEFLKDASGAWTVYEKVWEPKAGSKSRPFFTVFEPEEAGITSTGTKELQRLYGSKSPFSYPKSTKFLRHIFGLVDLNEGDLILDFFAGSGSTGHAVGLASGNLPGLHFLLVGLDEKVSGESDAKSLGFDVISEVAIDRLKRAAEADNYSKGLRVFRLGESAFRNFEIDSVENQLDIKIATQRGHADQSVLLSEIALASGLSLDSQWLEAEGQHAIWINYRVAICLQDAPQVDLMETLISQGIRTAIFLEDSFAGRDDVRSNLFFACKKANITFKTF